MFVARTGKSKTAKAANRPRRSVFIKPGHCLFFLTCLLVSACEPPLQLDAVHRERASALHRTDQFLSAANNGQVIVIVGAAGTAVTSTDQGETWTRQRLGPGHSLIDVVACPDGTLAALQYENGIWVSADNGASWLPKPTGSAEIPQAITCDPNNRIWVVGGFGTFLSSADKGDTWTENSLNEDLFLTAVLFLDEQTGFAAGEFGSVYKTTDGGHSWRYLEPIPNEFYPQDLHFSDESTGWAVGLNGVVMHTANGGMSWSRQPTNTNAPLFSIASLGDELYAVGGYGTLLRLDGNRWHPIAVGERTSAYLRAIAQVADDQLLTAGGFGTLRQVRGRRHD